MKEECDWPETISGEYSNTEGDNGGPTKFGIDLTSYRKNHPDSNEDSIKNLTYEESQQVYWDDYWIKFKCENHEFPLGEVFYNSHENGGHPDVWINQCEGNASKFLDLQEQYYKDLCAYWKKHGRKDPEKFLPDWLGRTKRLRTFLNIS